MTVTPTTRRPIRVRGRVAALLAMVITVTAAGGAATAAPAPSPTETDPGSVSLTLAPISNGVVSPGDPLTVSLTISNDTDAATPPATAEVLVGDEPLVDRAALESWLEGETDAADTRAVASASLAATDAHSAQTQGVTVTAAQLGFADRAPGVYPLVATADLSTGDLISTSVVIVPATDAAPTPIGIVLPVTAGPQNTALLTASQLTDLTAPGGGLTSVLEAASGTETVLAVDPSIAAAIRVLGTKAPESALAWLQRLEALPNPKFTLQFGDADVAAQLDAGASRPLAPLSFDFAMNAADFIYPDVPEPTDTPEPNPSVSPTPSPTPSAPATPEPSPMPEPDASSAVTLPSLSDLLAIADARTGIYWPATVSADVVSKLGALVDGESAGVTLVPSTATAEGEGSATVSAPAETGGAAVLVYDSVISRHVSDASALGDAALRGAPLAAASAHLAIATAEADGGPLLVALDRDADRSRVGLRAAIAAVTQTPGVAVASLDDLTGAPASQVQVLDTGETATQRAAVASDLFADEFELERFATILDEPEQLTSPERAEMLQLLGVSWMGDAAWEAAITAHRTETRETLGSVGILSFEDIQQLGPSANIPIWVRNELPFDAHVVLTATPDDLRLQVESAITVDAKARSNTQVLLPVNAQIGSGDVTIDLQLASTTGEQIGQQVSAQVSVRADWERYGIMALAFIVAGLFAVGFIRTLRRRRQRKHAEEGMDADDDALDDEDESLGIDRD